MSKYWLPSLQLNKNYGVNMSIHYKFFWLWVKKNAFFFSFYPLQVGVKNRLHTFYAFITDLNNIACMLVNLSLNLYFSFFFNLSQNLTCQHQQLKYHALLCHSMEIRTRELQVNTASSHPLPTSNSLHSESLYPSSTKMMPHSISSFQPYRCTSFSQNIPIPSKHCLEEIY